MTNAATNRKNPLLNPHGRYRVEFLDDSGAWQLNASSDVVSEARDMADTLDDMGYGCEIRVTDRETGQLEYHID